MKEKGFTLIELLAVIVILAIIALIATPIILNIINDVKEESNTRSAELYKVSAELAVARYQMNNQLDFTPTSCSVLENGNLDCVGANDIIVVEADGAIPSGGTIEFENSKISKIENLTFGNTAFSTDSNGNFVVSATVTYEIGQEIRLPGETRVVIEYVDQVGPSTTDISYTKWNVIDQTEKMVKLLSVNTLTNTGDLNYNSFIEDTLGVCSSCTMVDLSNFNIGDYSYTAEGVTYQLYVPTIEDLKNIITVDSANKTFTLKNNSYASWFMYYPSIEIYPILINSETYQGIGEYTLEPNGESVFNWYYGTFRPIIVINKSDIPDQTQFN